jgi:hypothetical protein
MAAIENQVQKSANSIGSYLSSAFTAGAIIAELQRVANAADEIHKQSARFNIDADEFQKVANAAKEMGISGEQVAQALNFIRINAEKALDPTTKQALAMEQLGISAKAFAAASPWEQVLMLSRAYVDANDKAAAYAEITQIGSRRMTEFIALLAQGPDKIKEFSGQFPILDKAMIDTVHDVKVQEEQALAELDDFFAKSVVGISLSIQLIKQEWTNFTDWFNINVASWWNKLPDWAKTGNIFGGTMAPGRVAAPGVYTPAASAAPTAAPSAVPTSPSASPSTGAPAPVGLTDLAAGGGLGLGGGGGGSGSTAEWLSGLNTAEKINTLLKERVDIQAKLDSAEEQGDKHAASRVALEQQRDTIDKNILALQNQLHVEEQKGVDAAARQIEKSKERIDLESLRNKGLEHEADILGVQYSFDDKIRAALDKANEARSKGLTDTAKQNELLAQQLEIEKQSALQTFRRSEVMKVLDPQYQVELKINELLAKRADLEDQIAIIVSRGATDTKESLAAQAQINEINAQIISIQSPLLGELNRLESERLLLVEQINYEVSRGSTNTPLIIANENKIVEIDRELLAVKHQINDENERSIALEEQAAAEEDARRHALSYGPNPLTINALASDNLRLGATSDVYAQALAASRGLKPGSPEYERLVQQITAQDQLRNLTGGNLSFSDQLARNSLVQWYAGIEQQQISQQAASQHNQMLNFWGILAGGGMPNMGNLLSALGFTPQGLAATFPGATQSQLDQVISLLNTISNNTAIVHIG